MTEKRGGSRPITRPDDARLNNPGGAREGAGRKIQNFTITLGKKYSIRYLDANDNTTLPDIVNITRVSRTELVLELDSGEKYMIGRL